MKELMTQTVILRNVELGSMLSSGIIIVTSAACRHCCGTDEIWRIVVLETVVMIVQQIGFQIIKFLNYESLIVLNFT